MGKSTVKKGAVNFEKLLNWRFFAIVAAFSAALCTLGAWSVKGAGLSMMLYVLLAVGNVVLLVMMLRGRGLVGWEPSPFSREGELGVIADDMRPEFNSGIAVGNVEGQYFVAEAADAYGALTIFPVAYDAASDTWWKSDYSSVLRKRRDSDLWMDADKQEAACERAAERARVRIEYGLRGTV
jgi:hypothetical protein